VFTVRYELNFCMLLEWPADLLHGTGTGLSPPAILFSPLSFISPKFHTNFHFNITPIRKIN
jgi:hypothetical protein